MTYQTTGKKNHLLPLLLTVMVLQCLLSIGSSIFYSAVNGTSMSIASLLGLITGTVLPLLLMYLSVHLKIHGKNGGAITCGILLVLVMLFSVLVTGSQVGRYLSGVQLISMFVSLALALLVLLFTLGAWKKGTLANLLCIVLIGLQSIWLLISWVQLFSVMRFIGLINIILALLTDALILVRCVLLGLICRNASQDNASTPAKAAKTRICMGCGVPMAADANYCTVCGRPMDAPVVFAAAAAPAAVHACLKCGKSLTPDMLFCTGCGHKVGTPLDAPAPKPDPVYVPQTPVLEQTAEMTPADAPIVTDAPVLDITPADDQQNTL